LRRTIQVTITDKHGGCKIALMNPETMLFQENENGEQTPYYPRLTSSQEYLWKVHTDCVQKVVDIADGAEILLMDLGDETQGNKYPQLLVSTRISDQITIADYNLRPWFNLPNLKTFRQVVGTQAHNFGEGSSAVSLCQVLEARYPGINIKPLYHGLLEYNGFTTDYAHHGPGTGNRNWLAGNVARFYLRDLMMNDIMSGQKPPDLVLRGHYHAPVKESLEIKGHFSEIYVLPSFSMLGDHSIQTTQSKSEITHGILVTEIEDGKLLRQHRLYETRDIRTREVL
jgi:hypothetical protein